MFSARQIWKITQPALLIITLSSFFLIPLIFKIDNEIRKQERTPIVKRVLNKFDRLKKKDSLALWNESRAWIHEYNYNKYRSISDFIKTTNFMYKNNSFDLKYKWYNAYSKQNMELEWELPKDIFYSSEQKRESVKDFSKYLRRIQDHLYNDFFLYSEFYMHDKDYLKIFSEQFLKFPQKTDDFYTEVAYNVISFIQNMPYIRMKEYHILNDSLIYVGLPSNDKNTRTGQGANSFSTTKFIPERSFQDNGKPIKHEVFSPVETLKYGTGDCDSRTSLAFTILKNLGYSVATMRIHYYEEGRSSWHSMLGIARVKSAGNNYFEYKGERYYYVELTKKNWWIGELTPDQKKYGRMIGMDMPEPHLQWGAL